MTRKIMFCLAIGIALVLLVTLAMPVIAADQKDEKKDEKKKEGSQPPETTAKTAVIGPQEGQEGVMTMNVAWVKYGPVSLSGYQIKDYYVSYGANIGGSGSAPGKYSPVVVATLSTPWVGNTRGHKYSINTETNYMHNYGAWVQISSMDSYGIPSNVYRYGKYWNSYINLIAIK